MYGLQRVDLRCDFVFHYVESASNIADGLTRPDNKGCQVQESVGTVDQHAFLAGWIADLWHPHAKDVLGEDEILVALD